MGKYKDFIKEISNEEAERFFASNCNGSFEKSRYTYAIYQSGKIEEILSFRAPLKKKTTQWVACNLCASNGNYLNGGVEDLIEFFEDKESPIVLSFETNNPILVDGTDISKIGFYKDNNGSLGVNSYSKFSGGTVYRMEVEGKDVFYIGSTTHANFKKYWGSGVAWHNYLKTHKIPRDKIKKIVIKDSFASIEEMLKCEMDEIYKYCFVNDKGRWEILPEYKDKMMNKNISEQYQVNFLACPECGGRKEQHLKTCSMYVDAKACPECGSKYRHRITCSHYVDNCVCPECGGKKGHHRKECSRRNIDPCPECGGYPGHKKGCSKYVEVGVCPECGSGGGRHRKTCSRYVATVCPECGGVSGRHKKTCSKYSDKMRDLDNCVCSECGGKRGNHKLNCSKYVPKNFSKKVCPECGTVGGNHKKGCSKFKGNPPCPECGSTGNHFKTCSRAKKTTIVCPECGGKRGLHRKGCSKYKARTCPECGGLSGNHQPTCSKYKVKKCPECGGIKGMHYKTCSHYNPPVCKECGGTHGHHKPTCSKYGNHKHDKK